MYLNLDWREFRMFINKRDFYSVCALISLVIGSVCAGFVSMGIFFCNFFVIWQHFFLYLYFVLFVFISYFVVEFFLVLLIIWILCFFVRRLITIAFSTQGNFSINLSLVFCILLLCWQPFQYISNFYIHQTALPFDCFSLHQGLLGILYFSLSTAYSVLNNLLILNVITSYFKIILIILLFGVWLLLFIESFWTWAGIRLINWNLFALLFCLVVFSIFFLLSNDLVLVFLNLIGLNIIVYSLIISENYNKSIIEASLKYFFLSTISSLFFIGGLLVLFAMWKTVNMFTLAVVTQHTVAHSMIEWLKYTCGDLFIKNSISSVFFISFMSWQNKLLGTYFFYVVFLLFVSFIFKLALFPLHSWAAEVYSTFSIRMLFIFIVFLKGVFFIKFIHIFVYALNVLIGGGMSFLFNKLLFFIVFGSIFVGSITALFEAKIKKIVAFSSTNQLGFVFAGLLLGNVVVLSPQNVFCAHIFNGLLVSFLFLVVYLTSMFILLILFSFCSLFFQRLKFITDVAHVNFFFLVSIMLLFFSFAGLPPLAGFFIKFYMLSHLWQFGFTWFTFGVVLLSVVSCFYYLRVAKIICFDLNSVWFLRRKSYFLFVLLTRDCRFVGNLYYFMFVLKFLMYICLLLYYYYFFFQLLFIF